MDNADINAQAEPDLNATAEPLTAPVQITATPTVDGMPPSPETVTTPRPLDQPDANGLAGPAAALGEGVGIVGEKVVWEGSYSPRNFLGRITVLVVLTAAWAVLAVQTWGLGREDLLPFAILLGFFLAVFWTALLYRMVQAVYG